MDSGFLFMILESLFISLPLIAVWIAGIVLSIIYMKKHKRVSKFALAVFILCFINLVLSQIASIMPYSFRNRGMSVTQIGFYMTFFNMIHTYISYIAWALIIAAVFVDRNNPQRVTKLDAKKVRRIKE
jgi:hypothetical protein